MSAILANRVDGCGPPLMVLNGGLMTIASWDPIVTPLFLRFRVVRCDFRGQLLSPGPGPLTMGGHADDLERLLDVLEIERAHLFGTSFGAEVAMMLAARRPARVGSLAVLAATDRLTPRMRHEAIALYTAARAAATGGDRTKLFRLLAPQTLSPGWLARQPADWVEQRAAQIAAFPREWFAGVADLMTALSSLDLRVDLGRITAPTLVIGAQLDLTFPVEHSRAIADAIPRARLEIIEGAGHGAVVEVPDTIRSLIESWLDAASAT